MGSQDPFILLFPIMAKLPMGSQLKVKLKGRDTYDNIPFYRFPPKMKNNFIFKYWLFNN